MNYKEAIAEINAQWAAGAIDSDGYAIERERLDYEYGEMMSAQGAPRVAA